MAFDRKLLLKLLVFLLKPVASFCVRHSLRLQDLVECAKLALVQAGKQQLESDQQKTNTSRISLMTGVHRRDVQRMLENPDSLEYPKDLVTKVIGQWQVDQRYLTKEGTPRVLSVEETPSEFDALVHSISKDMNPATVLFELERTNAVVRTRGGIRLMVESRVPQGNPEEGFNILASDSNDLTKTVEANVLEDEEPPHFHARTEFDNVRAEAIPELKRWFLREGHQFHARAREFIGQFDQDINPKPDTEDKGTRVVLGAYSFIEGEKKK